MDLIQHFSNLRLHCEDDEIINVDEINWSDDETWLIKSQQPKSGNLSDFFNTKHDGDTNIGILNKKFDKISKHIDTRTFTRPKKRLTPNIEEFYRIENESTLANLVDSDSIMFGSSSPTTTVKRNPEQVQFDLTQSITSAYFDKMNVDGSKFEYLENMSPPSLVNSLCSSTFANLMENSFIKNDPVLREIRDTDYTQTVLLQDIEPILFQSISDTCNNLEDTNNIESVDKTLVENSPDLNATFTKDIGNELKQTYQKSNSLNNSNQNSLLNNTSKTIEKFSSNENLLDQTITFEPYREKSPRLLNRRERTSLIVDNHKNNDNHTIDERINQTINNITTNENDKKPNSLNCSTDSENIEFMSISSGGSSSKDSYKMLNIDGINAIVEMQERSLQVMSTPITENQPLPFRINDKGFSPIISGNSNPELSSNNFVELDDINPIIETSPISTTLKRTDTTTLIRKPKTLNNRLQYTGANIRSSHPNLKMIDDNTRTIPSNNIRKTNLNTIGRTLKGSYTSLRPISTNLPVAPPLNTTIVQPKAQNIPQTNNQANVVKDETFVRPLPQRVSGLPRPVTGIPRPVSRIPAPKSARSLGKPVGLSGRKQ